MAAPYVSVVAQAAAFTVGCAIIHACRHHPRRATLALSALTFGLFLALLVAVVPEYVFDQESDAEAGSSIGSVYSSKLITTR